MPPRASPPKVDAVAWWILDFRRVSRRAVATRRFSGAIGVVMLSRCRVWAICRRGRGCILFQSILWTLCPWVCESVRVSHTAGNQLYRDTIVVFGCGCRPHAWPLVLAIESTLVVAARSTVCGL
jgi:hypothetical protein